MGKKNFEKNKWRKTAADSNVISSTVYTYMYVRLSLHVNAKVVTQLLPIAHSKWTCATCEKVQMYNYTCIYVHVHPCVYLGTFSKIVYVGQCHKFLQLTISVQGLSRCTNTCTLTHVHVHSALIHVHVHIVHLRSLCTKSQVADTLTLSSNVHKFGECAPI